MIGDTEMIDIVGYVENFLEVINECGANCNNRLLKVKIGSDEEFAIQFTGKGENIRKIERFTKPIYKKFKISKDKDNFYLDIKYHTYGTCPIIGSHIHHFIWLNDWIVFYKSEQSSTQTEVKVIPDEPFKKHYEVVL